MTIKRRLGTVAPNGAVYFESEDINEVRDFLWDAGLDIWKNKPIWMGWHSADETLFGGIHFSDGKFVGFYSVRS